MSDPRPHFRPDGVPTRCDVQCMTPTERTLLAVAQDIERLGASIALTDAVTLVAKARARVADHVEGAPAFLFTDNRHPLDDKTGTLGVSVNNVLHNYGIDRGYALRAALDLPPLDPKNPVRWRNFGVKARAKCEAWLALFDPATGEERPSARARGAP